MGNREGRIGRGTAEVLDELGTRRLPEEDQARGHALAALLLPVNAAALAGDAASPARDESQQAAGPL
jgi:hypothetical protein